MEKAKYDQGVRDKAIKTLKEHLDTIKEDKGK